MTERQPTGTFHPEHATGHSTSVAGGETPTSGPPAPPEDAPLPREFGRYELRRLLGRGGMGRVYLAHDPHLDRLVALKMPNPIQGVAGWRERFLAEARAAATLTHPHVCPVYDVGEVDGQPYLTMGFIEGETLAAKLGRDGPFAPADATELVRTVARAMHEAHRRGIVHRDLKPANLMLDPAGRPVVMDFGLAIRSTSADDLRLTLTGVALGTPQYMPPEQASGEHDDIGPPSDVYSLGVILYELVTGQVPFKGKSFGKILAQIERDVPPSPSSLNPAVDGALEAIILTCLAKSPADRFADAGALADALERYLDGDRAGISAAFGKPYRVPDATAEYRPSPSRFSTAVHPKPRRRSWWLAGAAALLVAAAAGAVIYVQTDYGELEVRLSDPNAKVDVRVNGQEVSLTPEGGKPIRIRAGKGQKLEVTGPDYETVSESFDLKRNGVTIVHVALSPRADVAKKPDDPANKPPVVDPPKKADPPKPVVYPERFTLIEVPGWQVLTDATRQEVQKWLDERKRDKHSVTWLDATDVDGKQVYTAVAACDDRGTDWVAALDIPGEALTTPEGMNKWVDGGQYRPVCVTGYIRGGEPRAALLCERGQSGWSARVGVPLASIDQFLKTLAEKGTNARQVRVFPGPDGTDLFAIAIEVQSGRDHTISTGLTETDLTRAIRDARDAGLRPVSVAASSSARGPHFAIAVRKNDPKVDWAVDHGLTAATLQARTLELAKQGYTPSSVSVYAWDGAVRYCVVWVKEPPRPVEYPKAPTLVEIPGWQVLTDATKEQMQTWLDERKKDKHAVTWLDAYQVGDKPAFCAVVALDNRQPGWKAVLELPSREFNTGGAVEEYFNPKSDSVACLSGYVKDGQPHFSLLTRPGRLQGWVSPDEPPDIFEQSVQKQTKDGIVPRVLRPFSIGQPNPRIAYSTQTAVAEKASFTWKASADELRAFVENVRSDGYRLTSIAAYTRQGNLEFAAVARPNAEKWEWQADTTLTAAELKTQATELATKGFRPMSVTGYAWDGVVRYCVVWVKEPPKPVKYPDKPTLIETGGWQVLTDATKDQMQKWLDERKEKKHSVTWLDVTTVEDKSLYTAVAALDDRQPGWITLLDVGPDETSVPALEKRLSTADNYPVSVAGHVRDKEVRFAALFYPGVKRWSIQPQVPRPFLEQHITGGKREGYIVNGLRPFTADDKLLWSIHLEAGPLLKAAYLTDGTADELDAFLKAQRDAGFIPQAFSACVWDGMVRYSAVLILDSAKREWLADRDLTSAGLKSKVGEMAAKGYRVSGLTAYPFDGAVRYCVVWVKEPPKEKEPAKK